MERRRKGYLMRKTDYFDQLNYSPQTNGNVVCSCNKSSSRSYDLQTQTITFEEEAPVTRNRNNYCLPNTRYSEDFQKVPDCSSPMDQDLEFYPIDDHPSPSTFTAWDAFLAGNQAFFREPPGLLPDPAFSYMDVIPEEDDLEALLESDTDDTGSSVSTVIDRFSRTSTANSSFSERCKGTPNVTFDLQTVLSPFERLEKEFEDESKDESLRRKEIPLGPIVVITNSSSCEDVHSADEEETLKTAEKLSSETNSDLMTENCIPENISETAANFESNAFSALNEPKTSDISQNLDNKPSSSDSKPEINKIPAVPARSKLASGSKSSDKSRNKSVKNENTSQSSSKSKKSYPTPSVPPRMSKHLPARRTRSDPGTPDQPSRIPRPISSTNRSPTTSTTSKSAPKNNKSSPKANTNKKIKLSDNSKSIKSAKTSSIVSESSVTEAKINFNSDKVEKASEAPTVEQNVLNIDVKYDGAEAIKNPREDSTDCEPVCETDNLIETIETCANDSTTIVLEDEPVAQQCDNLTPNPDLVPLSPASEERKTNPFRKNDTNPFKSDIESKNPFAVCSNPFEKSPEVTPALQPKGQMSASLIAPPIPERPSLRKKQESAAEPEILNLPEPVSTESIVEPESTIDSPPTETEEIFVDSIDVTDPPAEALSMKTTDTLSTSSINDVIEIALQEMDILDEKTSTSETSPADNLKQNDDSMLEYDSDSKSNSGNQQRPIEDILQALDQLVLSAPREVEISIDWGVRGAVNIREKTVLPSDASGDRSEISETDGLTDDRRRDIETLLKEVDECLRLQKASEDLSTQQPTDNQLPASDSILLATERTSLGPGSPDAPTAGSTTLSLSHNEDQGTQDTDILLEHPPSAMLKHQSQNILASEQRVGYSVPYQEVYSKTIEQLDEESIANKHNSSGCDDSGVFLEDPISSSPENQSRSAITRLQSTLEKLSNESPKMRQYSIQEGLDSDAEKSDDLGLASSSIDSADDLDGDPLPSTLQINSCPPVVTTKQKPPPVPARKSVSKSSDYQKNNRYFSEITTLEVPNYQKTPLSKSSSSGEDSNFGEGMPENHSLTFSLSEKSKNILNQQKNEQSRNNFAMTRSFHEEMLLNQQRDISQDSKSNFLARTLNSTGKSLEVSNGNSLYSRRSIEQPSSFKWKSEECLRTAAESKWSIPGRRYEKAVSVKDRIAMFSEMEANQNTSKRDDLQRYGSENNIKALAGITESKKLELPLNEDNKSASLSKDSKWHSMHSIAKKAIEKEAPYMNTNMKPAMSIPSLTSNSIIENIPSNYSTLPVKLEVEAPKPIVSTYPETQLTNNKRYNYGLYSLKNLKNTENLLSKKAAGTNFLSIIDSRKQPTQKLKGLVIPDKPYQANGSKELPTIVSSDSDGNKETRRASLPVTAVTAAKAMSLPRNKKLECVPAQRQTSLTEPPWKSENNTNYALPKYSPAFKKRSLELPGSSLSPTPPSSITSPMSPPPSSPSSICSSNASSTIQQNVFQFSLSHSKPVQPLQPEKALMSPPSLPSDVEYEGDNSEDSSHSASPMRSSVKNNKEAKTSSENQNPNVVHYGKSNTFTSSTKSVLHQPMMVETLAKSSPLPEMETPKPKAAIYLSKTEILLKKDEPRLDILSHDQDFLSAELISNSSKSNDQIRDIAAYKTSDLLQDETLSQVKTDILEIQNYEKRNGSRLDSHEYYSNGISSQNGVIRNGDLPTSLQQPFMSSEASQMDVPVGKFRALPVSLKETDAKSETNNNNIQNLESRHKNSRESSFWGNDHPHSECEESDDDSHSTLSHRTEDSRHVTTDDCLSDATTDSFEKPRLIPEPPSSQRMHDDNMSTEGYLSDASTDVSIRRFTNCTTYSTEEYLSDATADSPDPDWISHRGPMDQHNYSRSKSYGRNEHVNQSSNHVRDEEKSESSGKNVDLDLRPRRLSQQRTVLKASVEPSGSAQKFKALAEKWEQRADVISPPPPIVVPLISKKESKVQSIAAGMISNSNTSCTVIKGKSTLPPSLMPRNVSEKKASQSSKSLAKDNVFTVRTTVEKEMTATADGLIARKSSTSVSSVSTVIEATNNRWNPQQYDELSRLELSPRRDSTSSASNSSKTTLKDDEVFDSTSPLQPEMNGCSESKFDSVIPPVANTCEDIDAATRRPSQVSLPTRQDDIFSNEPRNRRGVDFTRSSTISDWPKPTRASFGTKSAFSVSDIRRSFENGSKEVEKPVIPPKRAPMPAARMNAPVPVVQPPPIPSRKPSLPSEDILEVDDELGMVTESARNQLYDEGVGNKFDVLTVVLRREGDGGGSVGITLAGGADYEVKEITVHKVISGSIADRDGRVLKGDRVMSINGRDLRGVSHGEALHILKAPSPRVVLVIARDKNRSPLQQNGTLEKEVKRRHDSVNNRDSELIMVELLKDATGLGFSIEGGKDSPQGDRPLLIKRIFKGGAADKDGQLEEGDEIVSANNQLVNNMTRTEAWNFLKKLPEGPVLLKARKSNLVVA